MNQDHNITDILTSLKQSVGDEVWNENQPITKNIVDREFSIDELQERLKKQYGDSTDSSQVKEETSYLSYHAIEMDTSDFLEADEPVEEPIEAPSEDELSDESPSDELPEEEEEELPEEEEEDD